MRSFVDSMKVSQRHKSPGTLFSRNILEHMTTRITRVGQTASRVSSFYLVERRITSVSKSANGPIAGEEEGERRGRNAAGVESTKREI